MRDDSAIDRRNDRRPPAWIAWPVLLMGGLICTAAMGILPSAEQSFHAPRWIVFLCGMLFLCGGVAALTGSGRSRMSHAMGAFIVLGLGTVGLWVGVYGDAHAFRGGLPFASHETNTAIARWIFRAGGAACCLLFAAMIWRGRGAV